MWKIILTEPNVSLVRSGISKHRTAHSAPHSFFELRSGHGNIIRFTGLEGAKKEGSRSNSDFCQFSLNRSSNSL